MEEKYLGVYRDNVHEDDEHIITICEIASRRIYDICSMKFDDPRLLAATFVKIYEGFLRTFKKKEEKYSDMTVNVANRIQFGYSTTSDSDDEKQGNFAVKIMHLDFNKKLDNSCDPDATPQEKATQWYTNNITNVKNGDISKNGEEGDIIKEISIETLSLLKDSDILMPSYEFIPLIFVTVHEEIVNYLKIKRRDMKEYELEINFCSCFFVSARETESGEDEIIFRPNISAKLGLKDDQKGSSSYE